MANFIGTKFTFNGETSDSHNVMLVKVGDGGMINTSLGGGRSPIEEWVINRDKPFFYKTKLEPRELQITIMLNTSATPTLTWSSAVRSEIFSWLYSPRGYCDFVSEDSVYIDKIIFTSPLELTTANLTDGYITLSAQALPHKYAPLQTTNVTVSSAPTALTINCLQNIQSPNNDLYFYPSMTVVVGAGGNIRIVNTSDSSRVFELTSLSVGETVTINNELKIITATVSTGLISKLTNKNWFRLKNGTNNLSITSLGTFTITAQYPVLG